MAYVWQEYHKQNRYNINLEKTSPYMEVWDTGDKENISVNPFFRISELIFPYSDPEKICELYQKYKSEGNYEDILNLIIHEIAQTDRLYGADLFFFFGEIEKRRILKGQYGCECMELFNGISDPDKQEVILRYLVKYDLRYQKETVFDAALNALFSGVRMYYENSTGHVHIFIGEKKTEENLRVYALASLLFKDIFVEDEVTWNCHFGIIGFDDTMITDNIQII